MIGRRHPGVAVLLAGVLLVVPGLDRRTTVTAATPAATDPASARRVTLGSSVVGFGHLLGSGRAQPFVTDPAYRQLLLDHFDGLTPENQLKWEVVHPVQDRYDFGPADAIVAFAEEHGMPVRGHALLWHNQNPAWLVADRYTDDELRDILRDHVTTVVGRYAGRIGQWDVANEILDDAGNARSENPFIARLGMGIVADAFRWAHAADPDATLFLNDYNVEAIGPKSDAYLALARDLLAEGVPVGGFGVQGHLALQYPFPSTLEANLQRFADLGLELAITELDVRMRLAGDPTDTQLTAQADIYRRVAEACLAVDACTSITLWGSPDAYSWVPGFFAGEGAATPFDADGTPKPAWDALQEALGRIE
ncbi:MAG: endo-1,4-beta-xylanase [Chloroflexi bacterium]|nr:endo-1,4-beta-xylanase [Chloroflexota bacterium]